jgi:hypothetical protein
MRLYWFTLRYGSKNLVWDVSWPGDENEFPGVSRSVPGSNISVPRNELVPGNGISGSPEANRWFLGAKLIPEIVT